MISNKGHFSVSGRLSGAVVTSPLGYFPYILAQSDSNRCRGSSTSVVMHQFRLGYSPLIDLKRPILSFIPCSKHHIDTDLPHESAT